MTSRWRAPGGKACPSPCAPARRWRRTPPRSRCTSGRSPAPAEQYPGVEPNVFRLGLMQPYITLTAMTIGASDGREHELELRSTPPRRTPYANLLAEMLRGDPTLFIRGDEAEETWRIIDPVMNAWRRGRPDAGVPRRHGAARRRGSHDVYFGSRSAKMIRGAAPMSARSENAWGGRRLAFTSFGWLSACAQDSSAAQPPAIVDTIAGAPWLVASRGARDRDPTSRRATVKPEHMSGCAKECARNRPESLRLRNDEPRI